MQAGAWWGSRGVPRRAHGTGLDSDHEIGLAYVTYVTYALFMASLLQFRKITDARDQLKAIYDSAEGHLPAVVQRDNDAPVAVVRRDDLTRALRALCPLDPKVQVHADSSVSMWLDDLPVHAQGDSWEAAESALVDALRDYAELWAEDLRRYPNHEQFWGVANLTLLLNDHELRAHVFGSDE